MFVFTIGQGFLLGVTLYIALPSLMVFLSLVLPVKITRVTNIVLPVIYGITIVGGAVGEWNYYILGSAIEVALLAGIAYYAWTWPKATADACHCPARRTSIAPGLTKAFSHEGCRQWRHPRTTAGDVWP